MKEVTEWNGKPRMMWVWDNNESVRVKRYVVHIITDEECTRFRSHPVMTPVRNYLHCAEIEEPKRMTRRELSWWLRDHPEEHREWKSEDGCVVYSAYIYADDKESEPCPDNILIRSNGGEWKEPLKESEE